MIKCVVFDFDDTLIKSEYAKTSTFFDVAKAYDGGEEKMKSIFSKPNRGNRYDMMLEFAKFISLNFRKDKKIEEIQKELVDDFSKKLEEKILKCELVKGAFEALNNLNEAGISCFVNSATPQEELQNTISKMGWSKFFLEIMGSPNSKLDNLQRIKEDYCFAKNEIIMVGDGDNDRLASEEFGCLFVGIKSEINKINKKIRYIANDMEEGYKIIVEIIRESNEKEN